MAESAFGYNCSVHILLVFLSNCTAVASAKRAVSAWVVGCGERLARSSTQTRAVTHPALTLPNVRQAHYSVFRIDMLSQSHRANTAAPDYRARRLWSLREIYECRDWWDSHVATRSTWRRRIKLLPVPIQLWPYCQDPRKQTDGGRRSINRFGGRYGGCFSTFSVWIWKTA